MKILKKLLKLLKLAHQSNVSVEGEIGFVGYSEGASSETTDPDQAKEFADKSKCDAMAISAGNVHLQTSKSSNIDFEVIKKIQDINRYPISSSWK